MDESSSKPYYRILSLDGGGIRGILTIVLLERLETAHPGFLDQIDLFVGTSTGGLLALGLAYGLVPEEAREIYEDWGERVFARTWLDRLRSLGSLIGARYSMDGLKTALEFYFEDLTLGDLPKRVLVSSFDLDKIPDDPYTPRTWKAKFFQNFPGPGTDAGERVVDVGIRTSAAPTYFPIYQGYIDGGVVVNNPAMSGLAQSLHPATGRQELPNVVLLSLGTGFNPRYIESQDGNWGLLQWAPSLVDLMLEGGSGVVDYQCRQILEKRYLRANPTLPRPVGMDAVDQMDLLKQIASEYDLTKAVGWIKRYFD
jgi:uncharacterized protein